MVKNIILNTIFFLALIINSAECQLKVQPSNEKQSVNYNLAIHLFPERHHIEVTGEIILPSEPFVRDSVLFSLRSDMPDINIEVIKPEICAGKVLLFELGDDKELQVTKLWNIKPKLPFPKGEKIQLKVSYSGGSEIKGSGQFNLSTEGSFGIGLISAWYPVFGYQRGSGSLSYIVPKGVVVKSSGRQTAKRDTNETSIYEFVFDKPSHFCFAAGLYTVIKRKEGKIPVTLYLFKDHPFLNEMLEGTSKAMEVLEKEFGKYPFDEFAIVESPTEASKAAGFLGAAFEGFFLARSDYLERNKFDLAYFGHELSHEWWAYLVGGKGGATTLMLDEAMAHYGSLRVVEELEGSHAAELHRRGNGDAFKLMAAGFDYPLGSLPDKQASYSLSNSKGYVIYDMLSRFVGREKFRIALRNVTSKYAFGRITLEEFLVEIQKAAGQDLSWFYEQWFNRAGAPTLSITWNQQNDSLKYIITQDTPVYRLTIPIQIEFSDGSAIIENAEVLKEKNNFTVKIIKQVYAVRLDPHFEIFHTTIEQKSEAKDLIYFTRGNSLWNSNQTDSALKTFQEGLKHLSELDIHGVEFLLRLYIGWIYQEANKFDDAKREYDLALAVPIKLSEYLSRLYLNVAQIAQEQKDYNRAIWASKNVLAIEKSLNKETGKTSQAKQLIIDSEKNKKGYK